MNILEKYREFQKVGKELDDMLKPIFIGIGSEMYDLERHYYFSKYSYDGFENPTSESVIIDPKHGSITFTARVNVGGYWDEHSILVPISQAQLGVNAVRDHLYKERLQEIERLREKSRLAEEARDEARRQFERNEYARLKAKFG